MAALRNIGNLANLLLQYHMRNKAAVADDERQLANQQAMEQMRNDQADRQFALSNPTSELAARLHLAPSSQQLMGNVTEDIGKATSPGAVPGREGIMGMLNKNHIPTSQVMDFAHPQQFSDGQDGTLPASTMGYADNPFVQQAMRTADETRKRLQPEYDVEHASNQEYYDESGNKFSATKPTSEWMKEGSRIAERSPQQEGQRQGQIDMSKFSTPGLGAASGKYEGEKKLGEVNFPGLTEALARQSGAQAGANRTATINAETTPDAIAAEANRETALTDARQVPDDAQRKNAGLFSQMVNADLASRKFEANANFRGIGPGLQFAITNPTAGSVMELFHTFDDNEKAYAGTAQEFSNTLAYIRSGQQVNAAEFARFLYNNYALSSDSPAIVKEKQNRRQVFLSSAQAAIGHSKTEAGVILGRAIKSGQIDLTQRSLGFTLDPEVQQGVNAVLQGKAQ